MPNPVPNLFKMSKAARAQQKAAALQRLGAKGAWSSSGVGGLPTKDPRTVPTDMAAFRAKMMGKKTAAIERLKAKGAWSSSGAGGLPTTGPSTGGVVGGVLGLTSESPKWMTRAAGWASKNPMAVTTGIGAISGFVGSGFSFSGLAAGAFTGMMGGRGRKGKGLGSPAGLKRGAMRAGKIGLGAGLGIAGAGAVFDWATRPTRSTIGASFGSMDRSPHYGATFSGMGNGIAGGY
jgi:hypothetical protein